LVLRRLLLEYGAVFAARGGSRPPTKVVFADEREVSDFQSSLEKQTEILGGIPITLQAAAMSALMEAVVEARSLELTITPRGREAAARTYAETAELWASRVEPALDHWVREGRLEPRHAAKIRSLEPFSQVWEVLSLEEKGLWFSKDLSKTILHSVAPPGASQHLSLLALDVEEFNDQHVRALLFRHGWFQTVTSDLPHFTFLGITESELRDVGLREVESHSRIFWVPDLREEGA
jgi:hypothetical protein